MALRQFIGLFGLFVCDVTQLIRHDLKIEIHETTHGTFFPTVQVRRTQHDTLSGYRIRSLQKPELPGVDKSNGYGNNVARLRVYIKGVFCASFM